MCNLISFLADFKWRNVELEEFLACEHNLAVNRQTRMLADLRLVDCYNTSAMPRQQRESILLASAMANLRDMDFVGLTENQVETKELFERTFGLLFKHSSFKVKKRTKAKEAMGKKQVMTDEQLQQVKQINHLDIQLYDFAKDLFFRRLSESRSTS